MGCSCSNHSLSNMITETNNNQNKINKSNDDDNNNLDQKYDTLYKLKYSANETPLNQKHNNLLIFTSEDSANDFIVIDWDGKEKYEESPFKMPYNSIAIGYSKGYKIESLNQDKFFVFVDGENEAFCVVDGHGPFGDIIAQIVQDKFFSYISSNMDKQLEMEYKKTLKNLFNDIQLSLINKEVKNEVDYDPFLSGCAVTIIIKQGKFLYSANVGNVLAFVIRNDQLCPGKVFIDQLTIDDSKINIDKLTEKKDSEVKNIHNGFNMNEELRRIYENGGEIRKLAGEEVSRIFIKGKYFPGVINTRALGDQIGTGIGILSQPHIERYHLNSETVYKLIMCSDGIGNVLSVDQISNIIQENDNCKLLLYITLLLLFVLVLLESINMIISEAQAFYRSAYSPDITILIKEIKRRKSIY